MNKLNIAITADLHLGTPFSFAGASQAKELGELQVKSLLELCRYCKNHEIEFLFVAGDLFDRINIEEALLRKVQQSFLLCPKTEVVIVPGNHDPYFPNSYWNDGRWPGNVHIVTKKHYFKEWKQQKLRVYSEPFTTQSSDTSLVDTLSPEIDSRFINILLMHGDLVQAGDRSRYNPIPKEWLATSEVDLAVLGHWHNATEVIQLNKKTAFIYPGVLMGRGFDELGDKGFYAGTIMKSSDLYDTRFFAKTRLNFIPLSQIKFFKQTLYLRIEEEESLEEAFQDSLVRKILQKAQNISGNIKRDAFYFQLTGYTAFTPDRDYISFALKDTFAHFQLDDFTRRAIHLERYLNEGNLRAQIAKDCLHLKDFLSQEKSDKGQENFWKMHLPKDFHNISPIKQKDIFERAVEKLFSLMDQGGG